MSSDTMQRDSLYREAFRAARAYEDDLTQRLGPKFADEAQTEWNRDHWWTWATGRVIQHLLGEAYWLELDPDKFASISKETPERLRKMQQLEDVQSKLNKDTLHPFAERESLLRNRASLINELLD